MDQERTYLLLGRDPLVIDKLLTESGVFFIRGTTVFISELDLLTQRNVTKGLRTSALY